MPHLPHIMQPLLLRDIKFLKNLTAGLRVTKPKINLAPEREKNVLDQNRKQIYIMTSVVSILQVIRDAAQRVYSFSNDQAG